MIHDAAVMEVGTKAAKMAMREVEELLLSFMVPNGKDESCAGARTRRVRYNMISAAGEIEQQSQTPGEKRGVT
jgi:hypothetical protein